MRGLTGIFAVLSVVAASLLMVPAGPASAQPSTPGILVPQNNATVSGADIAIDTGVSGATSVADFIFSSVGGRLVGYATATPTSYGWLGFWNSTNAVNGSYVVLAQASDAAGDTVDSATITIIVNNPQQTTNVLMPATGTIASGNEFLDAYASAPTGVVQFELSGGPDNYSDMVISGSTFTQWGWIGAWNTWSVPNGTYTVQSVATAGTVIVTSAPVSFAVENEGTVTLILPAQGSTVTQGQNVWFDAVVKAPIGVTFGGVGFYENDTFGPCGAGVAGGIGSTTADTPYGWLVSVPTNTGFFPVQSASCPATEYTAQVFFSDGTQAESNPVYLNVVA